MQNVRVSHGVFRNKEELVTESTTRVWTWANAMTFSGIASLVAAAWLVLFGSEKLLWLIPWLFGWGAGVSDALDGIIAKRTNSYTRLGRRMDPMRDRATIPFIVLIMWQVETSLHWTLCLPIIIAIEWRVAWHNKKNGAAGSHSWSKRRYLIHLVAMGQYIAQAYWDIWPGNISAVSVGIAMILGSMLALPIVYTRLPR